MNKEKLTVVIEKIALALQNTVHTRNKTSYAIVDSSSFTSRQPMTTLIRIIGMLPPLPLTLFFMAKHGRCR